MTRTLKTRSTGDDVRFLQELLNSRPPTARPPLTLDGKFGAKTRARVQEFQVNNALNIDGIAGPSTWGKLLGHTVVKTTGFFVLGRDLYDRRGARVILRGVNKMSVFDNEDPFGLVSFPEIKQTGANTVRIVWAITNNLQPGGSPTHQERQGQSSHPDDRVARRHRRLEPLKRAGYLLDAARGGANHQKTPELSAG